MASIPLSLKKKLEQRKAANALRVLPNSNNLIDFSSNDYLGFARSPLLANSAKAIAATKKNNGATGSRLLSGNHNLYATAEAKIAQFHNQESALIFNSGYNANVGFFSAVPQRGDVVFYDELIHASIRDGLAMGLAQSFNFKHNNFADLKLKVNRWKSKNTGVLYVVTESVFSMDGDSPDLKTLATFCEQNDIYLVVDEAHALGVIGKNGQGLVQSLQLTDKVFAQIITFGKAMGCHGAAILGSQDLKSYLVNFARSLIYTTALPPHAVATIQSSYTLLTQQNETVTALQNNIAYFNQKLVDLGLASLFIPSHSAIHCCIIAGNAKAKNLADNIQQQGFDVKAILSPTVPLGSERLRICLHRYNTTSEIESLLNLVSKIVNL